MMRRGCLDYLYGGAKILCPDPRVAGVVVWRDVLSEEKLINKVAIGSAKRGIDFQPVVCLDAGGHGPIQKGSPCRS